MEKSELTKEKLEPEIVEYTDEEKAYYYGIMSRLFHAKVDRDQKHPEFNNQTYLNYFNDNEKIANTFIERNETNKDFVVQSGTVEQKLQFILAEINRLNLTGEVRVFDHEDNELYEFATALTDICDKTNEIEGDEEKKLMRQLELLKQGTVFIQDNWIKRWQKQKIVSNKNIGSVNGVNWTEKLIKVYDCPERSVLYGPGVYLGNIREFDIKKQPFIFTMKVTSYEEAKSRFGQQKDGKYVWERWLSVPKKKTNLITSENITSSNVSNGFNLTDLQQDTIEEIHYQDQINNEYQIFLNGVAMLPVGFPLSAITPSGMFNIEKQVLQVINPFFAYGRSFTVKTKELSALLDEMIRLLVLKTRKSIHPPYANVSGRVISEKSLMPGAITMGIDPGALVSIGNEGQGATASEYQMLKELRDSIDRITVSPQTQGQPGKTGSTAYEISVLQQQAQKVIALIVFSSSQLEKKVTWLRLNYIMGYYFDPIGSEVDDIRNVLKNKYRVTSRKTNIEGRGAGIRKIIPVESINKTGTDIYNEEEYTDVAVSELGRKKSREELGMEPLQILYLDLSILSKTKYIFFIEVVAKPKDTSNNAKLMFREELKDIQALMSFGSNPNADELEKSYALIWGRRKEKLFKKANPIPSDTMANGSKVLNQGGGGPTAQPTEGLETDFNQQ